MAGVGRMVKESIVEQMTTQLTERPNFFVATINRLPASETDTFRQKLFASRARLLMIKRRLSRRAVEPLKMSGLMELLDGSIGLIFVSDDVLPVAKVLVEFRKTHEEQVTLKGAVVDGQLLDRQRVEQLASLPSRPVLLAEVLGTIEAPIASLIGTIEQLIGQVAWLAEQAASTKPLPAVPDTTGTSTAQAGQSTERSEGQAAAAPPATDSTPPPSGNAPANPAS